MTYTTFARRPIVALVANICIQYILDSYLVLELIQPRQGHFHTHCHYWYIINIIIYQFII